MRDATPYEIKVLQDLARVLRMHGWDTLPLSSRVAGTGWFAAVRYEYHAVPCPRLCCTASLLGGPFRHRNAPYRLRIRSFEPFFRMEELKGVRNTLAVRGLLPMVCISPTPVNKVDTPPQRAWKWRDLVSRTNLDELERGLLRELDATAV